MNFFGKLALIFVFIFGLSTVHVHDLDDHGDVDSTHCIQCFRTIKNLSLPIAAADFQLKIPLEVGEINLALNAPLFYSDQHYFIQKPRGPPLKFL